MLKGLETKLFNEPIERVFFSRRFFHSVTPQNAKRYEEKSFLSHDLIMKPLQSSLRSFPTRA